MKTLGEFYKDKVLSRDDLFSMECPDRNGDIEVSKSLFGWRLYCGKSIVECRSEDEARYLKVFFSAGMNEVQVPKDLDYLKTIVPELEVLKTKIDEIINLYLQAVLNRKIREQIRYEVYQEIIQ